MHKECHCVVHTWQADDDERLATVYASVPRIRVMESFTWCIIRLNPQMWLILVYTCKPHFKPLGARGLLLRWLAYVVLYYTDSYWQGPIRLKQLSVVAFLAPTVNVHATTGSGALCLVIYNYLANSLTIYTSSAWVLGLVVVLGLWMDKAILLSLNEP